MKNFIIQRWQGRVAWERLFWRDLLIVGTGFNLLTSGLALVLLALGVAVQWVLLAHLLALPYNLFIVSAILSAPKRPLWVLALSLGWLVVFLVV